MFHFIFSTGNNNYPQEAMTNIRDKDKKKKQNTGLNLCFSAWTLPQKWDRWRDRCIFCNYLQIDFEQIVFKNCITIYKIEMF